MKASLWKGLLALLVVLALCSPASAAYTLYDKEGATFTVDGFFNTFYAHSSTETETAGVKVASRDQSRVKMGFLPNYIGFNFTKQVGDLKLGGRSSFWVSINDSDDQIVDSNGDFVGHKVTDTGIDVRQFYGTVDADWGQVLVGKDFTLFSRSNIFLDEILLGFGNVSDTLGLIDGGGVSFGNIGSGYIYPSPTAQITYRTPDFNGFKLAIGLVDPANTSGSATHEENLPRLEGELTYNNTFDKLATTAWVGFLTQKSEQGTNGKVNSTGVSFGVNAKIAGFSLTGSGFTASGAGWLAGPGGDTALGLGVIDAAGDEVDSKGFLGQASYTIDKVRLVGSYGKTEVDYDPSSSLEDQTITGAVFYSVNANFILVGEYNQNKIDNGAGTEETTDTIAAGVVLTF